MQNFETIRQTLLGELAMSPEREKEEREKNAIYSGHLRLCQQPRAAHALRSDQNLKVSSADTCTEKFSANVDRLPIGGSRMRRPGSEDPHRH
jgi:hypothetical protein